jgi:hypothetical protein
VRPRGTQHVDGTEEVRPHDPIPHLGRGERALAGDARVVHDDVEPAPGVDGLGDDGGGGIGRRDAVGVGDRFATGGGDLGDDGLRGCGVAALTGPGAAEVVDDDTCAARRERVGVRSSEAVGGAGDDGDAPVEPQVVAHRSPSRTAAANAASSRIGSGPVAP